jgi:hypothetical protein
VVSINPSFTSIPICDKFQPFRNSHILNSFDFIEIHRDPWCDGENCEVREWSTGARSKGKPLNTSCHNLIALKVCACNLGKILNLLKVRRLVESASYEMTCGPNRIRGATVHMPLRRSQATIAAASRVVHGLKTGHTCHYSRSRQLAFVPLQSYDALLVRRFQQAGGADREQLKQM